MVLQAVKRYFTKRFDKAKISNYYAPMTPEQVIKHYGGERQAADALKLTRQAINYWKQAKVIPYRTQAWIQLHTDGALKAGNGKSA